MNTVSFRDAAKLLCGSAIFAVATATAPASAQAQTSAAAQQDEADENVVIVTARRREERLIDVPIAVTSISGETLENIGASDITAVADNAPNVTLEASRATNSTLSAFIRGIGQQDPVSGFEQGVGIYLDDVYLNRPQAALLDIYDVERIEVLRGPQGTLYGRNTIGGAIKYVTRRLPDEAALNVRATYGSYDRLEGVISGSAPINDKLRIGAAAAGLNRDGFGRNLTQGIDNYDKKLFAARGNMELGGYGEPVLIRISGDYTRDTSNPRGGSRLIPGLVSGASVLANEYDTRGGLADPKQKVEAYGVAMNVAIDLSDALTFKSISSWRKDDSQTPIDFDALPQVDLDVPGAYYNEQLSQELQLVYDDGDKLSALLGFYYLDATADTLFDVRLFTTFAGFTAFTQANVDTETYAVFGDATYDLTDQISISLGGRYTWDKRTADILRQNYLGGGSPAFGGAGIPFGAPSTDFQGSREFNKFTPRASISFKPSPDHNIYASYSQGFKGGGFDPRGVGVNAPDTDGVAGRSDEEIAAYLSFRPEQVDSYEVGYKGSLADGRIYVALTGFIADYTDVQIPGSVACNVSGIATFCGVVSNAGKASFKGLELETTATLARDLGSSGDKLNLTGSVGYIDAKYDEYITNIGGVPTDVAKFRKVQNTPEWTANARLNYTTPAGRGDIYMGAGLSYRSKTYQFEVPNPYIDQNAYALADASIIYSAPGKSWSLGLYGKNLTDKRVKTSGYTFIVINPVTGAPVLNGAGQVQSALGPEGTLTAFYNEPRQVFATLTFRY